jgi:hypothetical protein
MFIYLSCRTVSNTVLFTHFSYWTLKSDLQSCMRSRHYLKLDTISNEGNSIYYFESARNYMWITVCNKNNWEVVLSSQHYGLSHKVSRIEILYTKKLVKGYAHLVSGELALAFRNILPSNQFRGGGGRQRQLELTIVENKDTVHAMHGPFLFEKTKIKITSLVPQKIKQSRLVSQYWIYTPHPF